MQNAHRTTTTPCHKPHQPTLRETLEELNSFTQSSLFCRSVCCCPPALYLSASSCTTNLNTRVCMCQETSQTSVRFAKLCVRSHQPCARSETSNKTVLKGNFTIGFYTQGRRRSAFSGSSWASSSSCRRSPRAVSLSRPNATCLPSPLPVFFSSPAKAYHCRGPTLSFGDDRDRGLASAIHRQFDRRRALR